MFGLYADRVNLLCVPFLLIILIMKHNELKENLTYRLTGDLYLTLDHLSCIPGFLLCCSTAITNTTDAQYTSIAISGFAFSYGCPETQILRKAS